MIQEIVIVDQNDADFVRHLAAGHGVQVDEIPVRGIEPILTVTFVLLGATAAVATVAQLVDERKGGQMIDLRPGAPTAVYRTPNVVYGLVIVISEEGKVTVEVKEPKKMFGVVIEALQKITIELGKAGIEAIAKATKDQLGQDVKVELERPPRG